MAPVTVISHFSIFPTVVVGASVVASVVVSGAVVCSSVVVCSVEVGNTRPLDGVKLRYVNSAVVEEVQLAVKGVKAVGCKRCTRLMHIVCAALKLSKESLTEYGGTEAFKEAFGFQIGEV